MSGACSSRAPGTTSTRRASARRSASVASASLEERWRSPTARFLAQAHAFFRQRGVPLQAVMTDRAWAYTQARVFRTARVQLGLRHLVTRPYRPQTNGKAERVIKTLIHAWAYTRLFRSNAARLRTLPAWLTTYNHHRPHTALDGLTPMRALVNKAGGKHS